jgi:hypothetical protein
MKRRRNSPETVLEYGRRRFGLAMARMQGQRWQLGLDKIRKEKPLFIGDLIPNHSQLRLQSIYLEDSFKSRRNRFESDGKIPTRDEHDSGSDFSLTGRV